MQISTTFSRLITVICLIILSFVAATYTFANLDAPIQRDGAHFLFMAKNISHGQAPYWASFETKNPLVELYWSPFLIFFAERFGVGGAARIGEGVWSLLTAGALFYLIKSKTQILPNRKSALFLMSIGSALFVSLFYLSLSMDVRITDDGLNISLYQSLTELIVIIILLKPIDRLDFLHGALLGVTIFLAWFVKQTSILPVLALLAVFVFHVHARITRFWIIGVFSGSLILLSLLFVHLLLSETWSNYVLGTYLYKISLAGLALPTFAENAINAYKFPHQWDLNSVLGTHKIWTAFATVLLTLASLHIFWKARNISANDHTNALLLSNVWMWAVWLQAILSLTFFSHYFLASIAPVCLTLGLIVVNSKSCLARLTLVAIIVGFFVLFNSYVKIGQENKLRNETAPINLAAVEVLAILKPEDRVFNWSGLPHILLKHGAESAFPLNMNWPYIMTSISAAKRTDMLKFTLSVPPDVVIAYEEDYPLVQALNSEKITPERLKELTGYTYVLVHKTQVRPGRYGNSWHVFRKE